MDSPPPSTTTTTTSSILSSIGVEIISILSPVSLCMLLVVLLISTVHPSSPDPTPIRTAATLVYLESPSDSTSQKLQGALLNAAAFVVLIALVTFLLVLLYYYNFTSFLKHYMRFSAFFVFATMGGAIFLSVIQQFSLPIDSITCFVILFNFTAVGVLSVFSTGFPIIVRQGYMVSLGIIVAAWFSKLPEWTTWVLLIALAVYDLVAVLAPGGPLKLLVELASSRDEELPALIYEARPTVSREAVHAPSSSPPHELPSRSGLMVGGASETLSVELQTLSHPNNADYSMVEIEDAENSPLVVANSDHSDAINEHQPLIRTRNSDFALSGDSGIGTVHDEMSPLVEVMNLEDERARTGRDNEEFEISMSRGIKLGLGDFVFYSVLVGRAAMYDLMTVYACYLAIISGLGCTLILLSVCRRALPALPISIALGVMFYFLTRLLMEPFVVGASTNLVWQLGVVASTVTDVNLNSYCFIGLPIGYFLCLKTSLRVAVWQLGVDGKPVTDVNLNSYCFIGLPIGYFLCLKTSLRVTHNAPKSILEPMAMLTDQHIVQQAASISWDLMPVWKNTMAMLTDLHAWNISYTARGLPMRLQIL